MLPPGRIELPTSALPSAVRMPSILRRRAILLDEFYFWIACGAIPLHGFRANLLPMRVRMGGLGQSEAKAGTRHAAQEIAQRVVEAAQADQAYLCIWDRGAKDSASGCSPAGPGRCWSSTASAARAAGKDSNCGGQACASQSSHRSPSTRPNSDRLPVTTVSPLLLAWPAIRTS